MRRQAPIHAIRVPERGQDEPGALPGGPSLAEVAHQPDEHLGLLAHEDGCEFGVEVDLAAACKLRVLGSPRGAAQEAQERDVVELAPLAGGQSERVRYALGERARAQRMLHRLARAEIGGERDRGDELGEPDLGSFHAPPFEAGQANVPAGTMPDP